MKIGYARVSTQDQNLAIQNDLLLEAQCKGIYMVMTVFAGIGEFERELICERTSTGRVHAIKPGVRFVRPHRLSLDQGKLVFCLLKEGKSVRQVATTFDVHVAQSIDYEIQLEKAHAIHSCLRY